MGRSERIARARRIKLLILDVDGVMTDGRIILTSDGNEIKNFDVRDGFGLVMARQAGLHTAIITAERSAMVKARARRLRIEWVKQFARDKLKAFQECLAYFSLSPNVCAYFGDDLLDLPVLKRAGLSVTVPEAPAQVKRYTHYVTRRSGGHGAVREVVELILKAQGQWAPLLKRYTSS